MTHTIFHTLSKTIFHPPPFTHTIFHTPSLTHHLSHTTLSHTPSFTTRSLSHTIFHHTIFHADSFVTHHLSSTSSFVFPSFPVPATTFLAHYWKKLTCGVIRSLYFSTFNISLGEFHPCVQPQSLAPGQADAFLCCRLPNQQGNVRRIMAATQQRTTYTYTPSASFGHFMLYRLCLFHIFSNFARIILVTI